MSELSDSDLRGMALRAQDVAVLVRRDGRFSEVGPMPDWWAPVFGSAGEFRDRSAFLDDFVDGAGSELWEDPDAGGERSIQSGIWEEASIESGVAFDGGRQFFDAIAHRGPGGENLLIVSRANERWESEQGFIQNAHDLTLDRRRLRKELEKKQVLLQCIVHDLGNPLATVLMNLQHIERQLDERDRVLRPAVRRAVTQAERQRELIRSIAEVFAADLAGASPSGELESEPSVNLMSVAAETIAACAPAAAARKVTLCPFFSGPLFVIGESLPLSRVIENLLVNAIRHSPEGGQVTIAFEREESQAVCRVEDGGPGIDPAVAEQLFQPFAQGGSRPGQAGLGLYFCRMTVEMWGGTIRGMNRPEGGARFEFRLPLAPPESDAVAGEVPAKKP